VPVSLIALITGDVPSWDPFLARSSLDSRIRIHQVNGFERQRLGFEEEEEYDARCNEVTSKEDKAKGVTDAIVGIRAKKADEKVSLSLLDVHHALERQNLPSQLKAVAKEACFARVRSGNVSPITVGFPR